ncbi:MAG: methionine--tRNA ligase [Parcubacteria group bacterium]|nr:methionine--tRNA ligase [Parcubacteria group bacterium]
MEKKFYISTAIPYVNAPAHIGHALEFVQADVIARWHRRKGEDTFFLTGTDEHGAKIAKAASQQNLPPQKFVDGIAEQFQELARALNISNTDFIRTTDQKRHWPSVEVVWKELQKKGDLYEKEYEGLYCVGCEAFITQKDLADGKCKIHGTEPEHIKERNWFFRLSKYESQIREALEKDILRIVPETRKREMLSFISEGLQDVSFSRPRKDLAWGIPVPGDDTQTIYVWADALVNYLSVLEYPDGKKFKKYWPADIHVVGKDILRFHATIWPGILFALNLPLPRVIFVHGFINVGGEKMSKSLGNTVDPFQLIEEYGADAVRYFLLREIPSAEDGDFTEEKFQERYNADLANGLGNLVARVLKLVLNAQPPIPKSALTPGFQKIIDKNKRACDKAIEEFRFNEALVFIWNVIRYCDRYIERERPWEKHERQEKRIGNLLFAIQEIARLVASFLPETSQKILQQLQTNTSQPLFPRKET